MRTYQVLAEYLYYEKAIFNQLGFFTFNGTNFTGRKLLNGTHSGAISTYQSNHTIIYESGMQADFDDIRFGYENGTEVPYWLENKVDGVSADIWFKSFMQINLYLLNFINFKKSFS